MNFKWFKREKPLIKAIEEFAAVMEAQPEEVDEFAWTEGGPTHNGLPIIVVDDDFFEYLAEEGYSETIEYDELILVYEDWAAENVE